MTCSTESASTFWKFSESLSPRESLRPPPSLVGSRRRAPPSSTVVISGRRCAPTAHSGVTVRRTRSPTCWAVIEVTGVAKSVTIERRRRWSGNAPAGSRRQDCRLAGGCRCRPPDSTGQTPTALPSPPVTAAEVDVAPRGCAAAAFERGAAKLYLRSPPYPARARSGWRAR